jgi:SAM-dependent methyltransferase
MNSGDFDSAHGTDTAGEIPVELLDHASDVAPHAVSYEPTDPAAFRVMVRELPIDRSDYEFVDLGSGKGRAVLLAHQLGFGRVVGVEASLALHTVACQNLREWARAGNDTRNIRLQHADAATVAIPDGPCVVYLFNPFRERTVSRVLLNLKWSLQRQPRDLWLIYYNPQFGYMLENSPYMARITVGRGFQQGDYAIWRSHGEYRGTGVR